jgi:hypothetical protein
MVSEAFRAVHQIHLRRLDRMFDAEFERLRRKRERSSQIHVQHGRRWNGVARERRNAE